MPKGGYRIIDLNGANFTTSGTINFPGIYDAVEGTIGKPLLFTNFKFNEVEQNAAWVALKPVGNSYQGIWTGQIDGRNYIFNLFQDDNITLRATPIVQPAGDEPVSGEDGPSASM